MSRGRPRSEEVSFTMKPDMSLAPVRSRTNVTVDEERIAGAGPAVSDERMRFDHPAAPSEWRGPFDTYVPP